MEKIDWSLNVQVAGGPKTTIARTHEVDAYDKIQVTVPENASSVVAVQPGDADKIRFLLITADKHSAKVTYSVKDGVSDIALSAPHLLAGEGAVNLLGGPPCELTFTNREGAAVLIEILVGRLA